MIVRNSALLKGEEPKMEEKAEDFLEEPNQIDDAEKRRLEFQGEEKEKAKIK